jgi:exosortase
MTPALEVDRKAAVPWSNIAWFAALVLLSYASTAVSLIKEWGSNPDMGHGFFVPLVSGYIIWQRREELMAVPQRPSWMGLVVVLLGAAQLIVGTLGLELFTARSALVVTVIGAVWFVCGTEMLKKLAFPLGLLFFMIPLPAIIYSRITFPLQILASHLAADILDLLNVPVLRLGNVLELPNRTLSVVEACSGIRSLLSLTFLTLIYGYFFEKKRWVRITLFVATVPIAIVANAARVTVTGLLTQLRPDWAEGLVHESTGWMIFMVALFIMIFFHQPLLRAAQVIHSRRHA